MFLHLGHKMSPQRVPCATTRCLMISHYVGNEYFHSLSSLVVVFLREMRDKRRLNRYFNLISDEITLHHRRWERVNAYLAYYSG